MGYEMQEGQMPDSTTGYEGVVVFGSSAGYDFYNPKKNNWWNDRSGDPPVNVMKDKLELVINKDDGTASKKVKAKKLNCTGIMVEDWSRNPSPYGIFMDVNYLRSLEKEYNKLNNVKEDKKKVFSYNNVYVKVDDMKHVAAVEEILQGYGYQTDSMESIRKPLEEQTRQQQMIFGGLGAISLLVAALGLWEFFSLFWGNKRIPSRICAIALGWGMLTLTWAHRTQDALVCLGAGYVLAAMSFLFRWNEVEEEGVPAFASSGIFMAGLAYIPLLLLPATYLSTTKLLFVLAAVAISDTSAYFVGTRFGHHKLWPRVSPNKSSEGAVGSLVGCVIFCTIYGACLGSASWWAFALLGIAINAFAQLGDLFESALKRAVHVKDSSNLLPGHGGILDRADSILFAMPMFAVVDQWFFFF